MSKFIKGFIRLFNLIKPEENIEEIINYISEITLTNKNEIKIPFIIENIARKIFQNSEQLSIDERIYFQNSQKLRNLIINLYVCSECRIPVCLEGATALGKTSMTRAFSEIIRKEYAILYSFHMESQLTDLYFYF